MRAKKLIFLLTLCVIAVVMLGACSATRFLPDGQYMLSSVDVKSDNSDVDASLLSQYVRQKPNSKWFSLVKFPLFIYSLSGRDTTKWINRTIRGMGEAPVVFDTLLADRSANDLLMAMHNMGYMHSKVSLDTKTRGKSLKATYTLHPGTPYVIGDVSLKVDDEALSAVIVPDDITLHKGDILSVALLDAERKRVTNMLTSMGYYRFHREFITFDADTVAGSNEVALTMHVLPYKASATSPEQPHPQYFIDTIRVVPAGESPKVNLRSGVLSDNIALRSHMPFSSTDLTATYNNLSRLSAVKYTNVKFREHPDTFLLDADVMIDTSRPSTISFQPEGTNTAGDLGAAGVVTYQNRNFFRGSEVFSLEARVAFEAITGLEGYQNHNYEEYGVEAKILFPRLVAPIVRKRFKRNSKASSELSMAYNLQNRPEFHRRVLSAAWRYRWMNPDNGTSWRIDVADLNYIRMPWISDTFKHDYIDSLSSRNAILKYNYEDLFILKIGVSYLRSIRNHSLRINLETAGNILQSASSLFGAERNSDGQYTLFGIAFAQYAKFDIDYARHIILDDVNTLALHAAFGIACPYGNSKILPFEKRYFSGGANSLRGWGVRDVGPGGYSGGDGRIDFITHTGDMKLDLSAELRTKLFWKFSAAAFVDAGNIWTLRNYDDQPGGQFRFKSFYKQIAASYGLGIRLNLDYFVIRFDAGMKAVNPVYKDSREHFPIFYPRFSRDIAWHFAVGLPF
ncbi:MAG: BamA/TamA family outer membrane protein [Prevotella sp.]|nr:BamA/TamA family outer membrane protein [Prevotella sp.]